MLKSSRQKIIENSIRESAEMLTSDIINDMADPKDSYKIRDDKEFYVNLLTECKLSDKEYLVFQDHKSAIDEIYTIAGNLLKEE